MITLRATNVTKHNDLKTVSTSLIIKHFYYLTRLVSELSPSS